MPSSAKSETPIGRDPAALPIASTARRSRSPADHEFGSDATDLKISLIRNYSCAFTKALRGKFQLLYFDAFAGTGERTETVPAREAGFFAPATPERIIRHPGSAKIAIGVQPPFDRLIFIERRARAVKALRALRAENPGRPIDVITGDANVEIPRLLPIVDWQSSRAIMFLDPYGMTVDWATLQAIAKTRAIDLWFLFSLSGLTRQAAHRAAAIDEHKRAALTRALGSDDWERELYAPQGFFGDRRRTVNVAGLENDVRRRLETIFPTVLPAFALPPQRKPQLFSLFFAASNPSPAAAALASRIANHILKTGISSQCRPR